MDENDATTEGAKMLDGLMSLRELMEQAIANSNTIRAAGRMNYVPPTLWDIIEQNDEILRSLCGVLIDNTARMAAMATNEALMAHAEAVATAEDV